MRLPRKTIIITGLAATVAGSTLWLAPASQAAPAVFTSVYVGHVRAESSTSPTSVDISMNAPGSGGACIDITSGTAVGTACSVNVTATINTNARCIGTGAARFTYVPSIGSPTQIFNGTLVLHPQGGAFAGELLPLGPTRLGGAHLHFLLTSSPCGGSQQQPSIANGNFAGIFSEVG